LFIGFFGYARSYMKRMTKRTSTQHENLETV